MPYVRACASIVGRPVFNDTEIKPCIRGFIDGDPINADQTIAVLYCACMAEEVNGTVLPGDLFALKAGNGEQFCLKFQFAQSKCVGRIKKGSANADRKHTFANQLFDEDFRGKCIQGWIDRGRNKENSTQFCGCLTNDLNLVMTKENMDSALAGKSSAFHAKFNAAIVKCSSKQSSSDSQSTSQQPTPRGQSATWENASNGGINVGVNPALIKGGK